MARILAAIILLYATSVQSADNFKTDKAECDEWGKAFYLVAEWAMKTGFCNNILENAPKAYDKLSLIRRGVTI